MLKIWEIRCGFTLRDKVGDIYAQLIGDQPGLILEKSSETLMIWWTISSLENSLISSMLSRLSRWHDPSCFSYFLSNRYRSCHRVSRDIDEDYELLPFGFILFLFMMVVEICLQVRRTKISERMRKLQDLVPNMDKVRHYCMICLAFVKVSNLTCFAHTPRLVWIVDARDTTLFLSL